jgi:hypothetical protein
MEIEIGPLALREATDIDDAPRLDAHALERRQVRDRREDEITMVFEADESPIEQVINAGRQQQSVFSVEALFVRV